jgi:hypothetical protein
MNLSDGDESESYRMRTGRLEVERCLPSDVTSISQQKRAASTCDASNSSSLSASKMPNHGSSFRRRKKIQHIDTTGSRTPILSSAVALFASSRQTRDTITPQAGPPHERGASHHPDSPIPFDHGRNDMREKTPSPGRFNRIPLSSPAAKHISLVYF